MESPAHLQRSHTLANVLDFAEGRSLGLGSLVALGGQPSALPLSLGQLLRGAGRWTHLGAIPQRGRLSGKEVPLEHTRGLEVALNGTGKLLV